MSPPPPSWQVLTTPMPKMPTGPAFKYQPEPGTSGVPGF
jgi:hypothetical protein